MSTSRLRILGLTIVSSWLAVGCSGAKKIDVGGACVLNSDCNQGLVCTWGKCHDACHKSADCPTGQSCITTSDQSTVCQLPAETNCLYDSECPTVLKCAADERCHNQCQTTVDCPSGQVCANTKACAEPSQVDSNNNLIAPDGGVSGSGGASGAGGSGGPNLDASPDLPVDMAGSTGGITSTGGTTVTDGSAATGGTGGAGSCPTGAETCSCYPNDTCNTGLTCASHLCVRFATGGAGGAGGSISSNPDAPADLPARESGLEAAPDGGPVGAGGTDTGGAGTSGTGTDGSTGGASNMVTFQDGAAIGPMTGLAWISRGALDSVTDPTCGGSRALIPYDAPCVGGINWNASNALCVTGYIPVVPPNPSLDDWNNNWGIYIGVNASRTGDPIGKAYSTIAVSVSGAPTSGLRLELHRVGDPVTTTYCHDVVSSGTPVSLAKFNTACWDNSGIALVAADFANIDKVAVQISSTTQTAITVTNMCLNSITFGE